MEENTDNSRKAGKEKLTPKGKGKGKGVGL